MSINQYQNSLNQVDKNIASLEKKLANYAKSEAEKTRRISSIEKSITKNTSVSTLNSKLKQISTLRNELSRIVTQKADINKKIAEKRSKRNDLSIKVQKEQEKQTKKEFEARKRIEETYKKQIADLTQVVNSGLSLVKNSSNLSVYENDTNEEYDVFISHASEDKESFVNEFADVLKNLGLNIWYDDNNIKWGDSIRTSIDIGLKKCKFGIVILSRHYLSKHWTNYELEGLFQRESTDGKLILPIWHNITKKEIQDFSPVLAGKMAINTAIMTPEEIGQQLLELVNSTKVN